MSGRRNIIQDIISSKGSSSAHRSRAPEAVDPAREKVLRGRAAGPMKWAVRAIILLFVVSVGFWVSSAFGHVEVYVTPRNQVVSIDRNFIAREVPPAALGDIGDYDVIELSQAAERAVTATGQEFIERSARGTITVYNDHSAKSERLIARTRFETPDGRVYRIEKAISVPGKTGETPGTLEVEVVADEVGAEYNIEEGAEVTFTIPGLQGDARYANMYAKLKTPITGGFSGIQKSASEKDIETAVRAVRDEASANLVALLQEQVPPEYVLFDDAIVLGFEREPGDASGGNGDDYVVKGTATAYGVVFNRESLSSLIARRELEGYDGSALLVENLDTIEFDFLNKEAYIPGETDQIVFNISGPVRFVWQYDQETLLAKLLGVKKTEFQQVFLAFPAIKRAESKLSPSWRRYLPDEPEKIDIIRTLDEATG